MAEIRNYTVNFSRDRRHAVISAQAGIQRLFDLGANVRAWIPAFAGMTGVYIYPVGAGCYHG